MPLNKTALETSIKAAFKKAQATPPPSDSSQSQQVQETILTNLSKDLAEAINAFIVSGDISNLRSSVTVNLNTGQGTGTQDGTIHIQ